MEYLSLKLLIFTHVAFGEKEIALRSLHSRHISRPVGRVLILY